ncbi:MAG: hypothetical protein QOG04_30 [Actinomycetota bacterium]|jgi:hypothetical protein|nr:hypothetical protein [Actinomycetota bacterium]
MGTTKRWKTWLGCLLFLFAAFGLIWLKNPVNIGSERESQRAWLALGYSAITLFVFVPPLVFRTPIEIAAQRALIICITVGITISVWWVGFLPSDPLGCSRVDAPDCHTTAATRWRALTEGVSILAIAFVVTYLVGSFIARRRIKHPVMPDR